MRNNEDRFATNQAQVPASSVANMHYVAPTELVELPSKGAFYPENHPLYGKEFIEIKHMTTKEEDILSSSSLIEKGVVLDYLMKSIVVDKSLDIKDILPGDQNAIFLSARVNAYGPEYSFSFQCRQCSKSTTVERDLSEFKPKDNINNFDVNNGLIKIDLEKSGLTLQLRQLTIKESNLMEQYIKKNEASGMSYGSTTTLLLFIIDSIDGEKNARDLNAINIIENLPSKDVRQIKKVYVETKPDIDFSMTLQCGHCGHSKEESLPITANFFWPDA